jgi:hypothetical protein
LKEQLKTNEKLKLIINTIKQEIKGFWKVFVNKKLVLFLFFDTITFFKSFHNPYYY